MLDKKLKVKELINSLDIKRVSPVLIARKLPAMSEEEINSIIFQLAKEDFLEIIYEISCPECASDVETISSLRDIPDRLECDICGHDFEPDESDIWIFIKVKEPKKSYKDITLKENDFLPLNKVLNDESFQENVIDKDFFQLDISKLKKLCEKIKNDTIEKNNVLDEIVQLLFSSINKCKVLNKNPYKVLENNNQLDTILKEIGSLVPIKVIPDMIKVDDIEVFGKYLVEKKFEGGVLFTIKECNTSDHENVNKALITIFLEKNVMIYTITGDDIKKILDGENLLTILRHKNHQLRLTEINKTQLEILYDYLFKKVPKIPAFLIFFIVGLVSFIFSQYLGLYFTIIALVLFTYAIIYLWTETKGKIKTALSIIVSIICIFTLIFLLKPYVINLPI